MPPSIARALGAIAHSHGRAGLIAPPRRTRPGDRRGARRQLLANRGAKSQFLGNSAPLHHRSWTSRRRRIRRGWPSGWGLAARRSELVALDVPTSTGTSRHARHHSPRQDRPNRRRRVGRGVCQIAAAPAGPSGLLLDTAAITQERSATMERGLASGSGRPGRGPCHGPPDN